MPEGDTVHKLAAALSDALLDRRLRGLWLRDRGWLAPLEGLAVVDVAARGKHLLMALGDSGMRRPAWVLHVHLGMRGRWHRMGGGAPRGEMRADGSTEGAAAAADSSAAAAARRIPGAIPDAIPGAPSVCLETEGVRYACSRAAVAEVLRAVDLALHPALARLGPDLLDPPIPFAGIVARARAREPRSVAELLLDQRVACGIGNVYKSEVLFLEGIHPATSPARLSDAQLAALYRRAADLLARNLGGWPRTTVRRVAPGGLPRPGEPRLWVYGRAGAPCLRCGAPVRARRLGDGARSTYWCGRCQPERAGAAGAEVRPPVG